MAGNANSLWTDERKELLARLQALSDAMAGDMYECIIDSIGSYEDKDPKATIAIMDISHNVREFMNATDYFFDTSFVAEGNTNRDEFSALAKVREALLDEDSIVEMDGKEKSFKISSELATALEDLRRLQQRGWSSRLDKDSLAVQGRRDLSNPALCSWRKAKDFFMAYVHFCRDARRDVPAKGEVIEHLRLVENSLYVRIGPFFESMKELRRLTDKANLKKDGAFRVADENAVNTAVSYLGNVHLRRYFFSALRNPEWLHPLTDLGVFCNAPNLNEEEKTYPDWPEGIYLGLVASSCPGAVVEILQGLITEDNPVVRRKSIEIAATLNPDKAAQIALEIKKWAEMEYRMNGSFWHSESLVRLIAGFLKSKSEKKIGKGLLSACFAPKAKGKYAFDVTVCVGSFLYERKLEELLGLLSENEKYGVMRSFVRKLSPDGGFEQLILCPEIKRVVHSESIRIPYSIIRLFISSFSSLGLDSQIEKLHKDKKRQPPLVLRCELFALGESIEAPEGLDTPSIERLKESLLSEEVLGGECDPEAFLLIKMLVSAELMSCLEIVRAVEDSYCGIICRIKEGRPGIGKDEVEKRARKRQHKMLNLAGVNLLNCGVENRPLVSSLNEEFGDREYSAALIAETETVVGPNSSLSLDEMELKGPSDLLDYLVGWHPSSEDAANLVEHEGNGRVLKELLTKRPFFFESVKGRLVCLRPTYLRALFDGWRECLSRGEEVPFDTALNLACVISGKDDVSSFPGEGDALADDRGYVKAKLSVVNMIKELIDLNCPQEEAIQGKVASILCCLSYCSQPDERIEEEYGRGGLDPLTISVNTVRPAAIIALSKWVSKNQQSGFCGPVLMRLATCLPSSSDCLISDAAAIGVSIPMLCRSERAWVDEHYVDLFGDDGSRTPAQEIVISTILSYYRPCGMLLDLMRPLFTAQTLSAMSNYLLGFYLGVDKRDCSLLLGDWLYCGVVNGTIQLDDELLQGWWRFASASQIGSALSRICMGVQQHEEPSCEMVAGMKSLYDYHMKTLASEKGVESLSGIWRLAATSGFGTSWWGSRLLNELEITGKSLDILLVSDELGALSEEDPKLATRALVQIAKNDANPLPFKYEEVGLRVLRKNLQSNGGILSEEGMECIDLLGRIGCINLDKELGLT